MVFMCVNMFLFALKSMKDLFGPSKQIINTNFLLENISSVQKKQQKAWFRNFLNHAFFFFWTLEIFSCNCYLQSDLSERNTTNIFYDILMTSALYYLFSYPESLWKRYRSMLEMLLLLSTQTKVIFYRVNSDHLLVVPSLL